jgi:PEGA domain
MDDSPEVTVAVATIRAEGGSWSGVRDSFGERATAVDANGRSVDLLRLFAAFTPAHQAVADRIERLKADRPAVSRTIALERDEPSGRLILISEHVPGMRLSELLQIAVERSVVADLGAALFVMRRLLTLAESLKAATRVTQFSIAPERIVITPHGRIVITEPVLAAAAETAAVGLNDVAGIAIAGMSIMLGHHIEDSEHIDPLSPVLQDAADVAAIRAGNKFSTALRLWFDRAIIADPALSFPDFRQARLALSGVGRPRESGCDASRRALKLFLNDLSIERMTDVEEAALEVDRLREIRAKQRARRKAIFAPDEEWISVEDELLIGHESRTGSEEIQDSVVHTSDERADEAIEIGSLAGAEMAARVEERLEAAPLEEPIDPTPLEEPIEAVPLEEPVDTAQAPPRSWMRSVARQLGLASAEPERLQSELATSTGNVPLDSPPVEQLAETAAEPAGAELEVAPESSTFSTEPEMEEASTEAALASLAEVDEEPIEIADAEPTVETIEEPLTNQAEALAVDGLDRPPMVDPAIETQEERPAEGTQDVTDFSAEEYESTPIDGGEAEESEVLDRLETNPPETVAAESWSEWTEPAVQETLARRADDNEERPAYAIEEEPTGVVEADPAVEPLEESLTEEADALAVDPFDAEADAEPEILERPAESLAEQYAAESSRSWTDPVYEESFAEKVEGEERLAETFEEEAEAADSERPVETIDAPLEADQPIASVDESIAATLSEDAHKSWIKSISEQLGRLRRREEDLREPAAEAAAATNAASLEDDSEADSPGEPREPVEEIEALVADDLTDTLPVEAATVQLERAAIPRVEQSDQPAAWVTPEPWRHAAPAAGKAMSFPAEPVAPEYAPYHGELHEHQADAQPYKPAAFQPAKEWPSPRTIDVPAREWKRAAATVLIAGLAIVIVAALVIAGRSYYGRMRTPGTITVDSTPRGSEVLVDGAARGVTPLTLGLKPGNHVLELRRNGITRQFAIAITPGAQYTQQLDWSTVKATGTLVISSTPSQAKVLVDGKERGVTPLTLSDVPVGMRRVVIESSAGTVRRDVTVVADSKVTIDESIISGWIATFAPFELQIFEGTRLLGTTESGRLMMRPGRHELDLVNKRLGFRERRGVDVNPGATTAVNVDTVVGIVRITAPAGADVLIDGVLFGDTPLRELSLPLGTHEIVLRHPQLGERRVSVTVGASAPTEVSVDFSKQ